MTYTVIIKHAGAEARLSCQTMEEAELVQRSFMNWGGLGYDLYIEPEYP